MRFVANFGNLQATPKGRQDANQLVYRHNELRDYQQKISTRQIHILHKLIVNIPYSVLVFQQFFIKRVDISGKSASEA